jgi:predicted RNase H-like HicB family nuclease
MKRYRIKLDKEEYTDDLGMQYTSYTVTSPDIKDLVTEGKDLVECVLNAYECAGLLLKDDDYNFRLVVMK